MICGLSVEITVLTSLFMPNTGDAKNTAQKLTGDSGKSVTEAAKDKGQQATQAAKDAASKASDTVSQALGGGGMHLELPCREC